ncbi:CLUMA_CG014311, isoform A [Clunio marinus]|uniref:CLUMA_CG014311, isoform A n=1 Tax=Clunio marinus TaxID=568069 RepID=A0A1J1INE6_9DIPT|nr:CLUMA_CG014311, isoform A [Clunio marinus]
MLKKPNPQLFRLIKKTAAFLIFAETAAFAGTYLAWYKLNTSRDFRYYFHTNYPVVLEGYYKVGEYFGAFGSLGYILLKLTEPSEEKKKQIAQTGYSDPSSGESQKKKALFLEKLKQASVTETPIYLKKKESKTSDQEAPKQPTKREIN